MTGAFQALLLVTLILKASQAAIQRCDNPPDSLLGRLTPTERAQLRESGFCWPGSPPISIEHDSSAIPPGVECDAEQWCGQGGAVCSTVCARGSVRVPRWLDHATRTQTKLSNAQPFCRSSNLGTHNSAITIADGYGNDDRYWATLLQYWPHLDPGHRTIRTHDQSLSLTDQLNLGVRVVELDVHWVAGELRIAHCGGVSIPAFDALLHVVNILTKALGLPLHWDTETIGCNPSLSSIAVTKQRSAREAMEEVAAWMGAPGNEDEFLVLYLDDEPDMQRWGKVPRLLEQLQEAFTPEHILRPDEKQALFGDEWPSIDAMKRAGKRLMLVSRTDYGPDMSDWVFAEGAAVCDWHEITPQMFNATACTEEGAPESADGGGSLTRLVSCEILYGPFNCNGQLDSDVTPLAGGLMAAAAGCGVGIVAGDRFTPARAADFVWSWAEGHPWPLVPLPDAPPGQPSSAIASGGCVAMRAADGRWLRMPCSRLALQACGAPGENGMRWALVPVGAACPEGLGAMTPQTGAANEGLRRELLRRGEDLARLPIVGPDFEVAPIPPMML